MMIAMKKLTAWLLTLAMCLTMMPWLTMEAKAATGDPCELAVYIGPGEEAGSVKCNKAAPYYVGDSITLEATAKSGYTFSGWVNNATEEVRYESTITFVLEGDTEWVAVFEKDGEYFIYVSEPEDLEVSPSKSSYSAGTKITLNAPVLSDSTRVYEIGMDVDGKVDSVTWERLDGNTFTMPEGDVWVRALYTKFPEVTYYTSEFSYEVTDENIIKTNVTYTKNKTTDFQIVDENTTEWRRDPDGIFNGSNGIFVVDRDVTIKDRVNVSCTPGSKVTLIICDGCTLTAEEGITVPEHVRLDICVQRYGDDAMDQDAGKLYAGLNADTVRSCSPFSAGIGGTSGDGKQNCGKIYIHGGTVVAAAGNNYTYTLEDGTTTSGQQEGGAGIGGGAYGNGGTVYICCANVLALGGYNVAAGGAGIGGGAGGTGGTINIFKSNVAATSGGTTYGGAGIGSGGLVSGKEKVVYNENAAGSIILVDSKVTATGGNDNAMLGGAGIGSGAESGGGTVRILGGNVKATGASGAAGIGGGTAGGACDLVEIVSAHVEAYGGDNPTEGKNPVCGAGIGSGGNMMVQNTALPGGKVIIAGEAEVTAVGGSDYAGLPEANGGAGIGAGGCGNFLLTLLGGTVPSAGSDVMISGGTVVARGGSAGQNGSCNGGAGIGTGGFVGTNDNIIDFGKLTITGGDVQAYGGNGVSGYGGAGVGIGGTDATHTCRFEGVPVKLAGGSLVAVGGDGNTAVRLGQAISGGSFENNNITVTNSMAGAGWTTGDRSDNGTSIGIETENARYIGWYRAAAFPAYALTLKSNDGTDGEITRYAISGDKLPANAFSRTDYIIEGWNTLAAPTDENTGTAYSDEQVLELTGNLTLYAQWKETEIVATPEFSPDSGTFGLAQNVRISCETEGATIYYTTDGSTPTTDCTVYSSEINVSEDTTIKAIAVKDGMVNSAIASATYTINNPVTPPEPVAVTGVILNKDKITLTVGDTATLEATVEPVNAANKDVTWSSNKTGVASVDADGKLTAVSAGTATITVITTDGGKTATCTVTVKSASDSGGSSSGGKGGNDGSSGNGGATSGGLNGGNSGASTGGSGSGLSGSGGNTPVTGAQKPAGEQPQVTGQTMINEVNTPLAGTHAFEDVTPGAFYAEPVAWAIEHGITNGIEENKFGPEEKCSRGQVLTFIYRAMGSPTVTAGGENFTDVDSDAYYRDAVTWAVEMGITSGTSGTEFSPDETCNRAQIVTLLWRLAGQPKVEATGSFADVTPDMYCYDAVAWAVSMGITLGTSDTTFSPDETCNRGQVVTFLYRYEKTRA